MSGCGDVDFSLDAVRFRATGDVDRVPEETVARHSNADDASHDVARVNADTNLERKIYVFSYLLRLLRYLNVAHSARVGMLHVFHAFHHVDRLIGDVFGVIDVDRRQTTDYHVGVANRLHL